MKVKIKLSDSNTANLAVREFIFSLAVGIDFGFYLKSKKSIPTAREKIKPSDSSISCQGALFLAI